MDAGVVMVGGDLLASGWQGSMARLKRHSGQTIWQKDVQTGVRPLVMRDKVFAVDVNGRVNAFDFDSGLALWTQDIGEKILSAPVAFQEHVFVASYGGQGFFIDPESGDVVQRVSLRKGSFNTPVVHYNNLIVLNKAGELLVFKAVD